MYVCFVVGIGVVFDWFVWLCVVFLVVCVWC